MTKTQRDLLRTSLIVPDGPDKFKFHPIGSLPNFAGDQPFFWSGKGNHEAAPSGWYQWKDSGLVYLGESILERA